jgi:hypothetical protein
VDPILGRENQLCSIERYDFRKIQLKDFDCKYHRKVHTLTKIGIMSPFLNKNLPLPLFNT